MLNLKHLVKVGFQIFCQTSDLGLRLEVDFVFPLSQEQQQPLTKIYRTDMGHTTNCPPYKKALEKFVLLQKGLRKICPTTKSPPFSKGLL